MKMMKIKHILYFFTLITLLGCSTVRNLEQINLAHLYQDDGVALKPLFRIYHRNADTSRIYFEASSDQLLYVKEQSQEDFIARIGISYRLYTDYQLTTLVDSGSLTIADIQPNPKAGIIFGEFDVYFKHKGPSERYVLEVFIKDKNRNLTYIDLLQLDKSDKQSAQNFLMTTPRNRIIFSNHYVQNVPFLLKHNSHPDTYVVRYYNREFPVASPPYAKNVDQTFSYKADSIWQIPADSAITLTMPGFYHFQIDQSSKAGFTVFSFYNEFPYVSRKTNLGPPLRYLTTNDEFEKIDLSNPDSMKLEADRFWLRMSGTVERGKMMVSAYYSRVELANMYFTSYIEGWKTDRGIIYTILGPPTEVTRNAYQEYWVYGDPNSVLQHIYVFSKITNPFTENDYALSRSNNFRYGWGQAIESWRNGQIYTIKEIKRAQDERDRQQRANTPPYFWY